MFHLWFRAPCQNPQLSILIHVAASSVIEIRCEGTNTSYVLPVHTEYIILGIRKDLHLCSLKVKFGTIVHPALTARRTTFFT